MIKYATAIRTGTASTEAILRALHPRRLPPRLRRRCWRSAAPSAPIFVARYLRDRDLQREIEEGLNVVEACNRANAVIYYGKGGEIATNRPRGTVEMAALCLRILQGLDRST